MCFSRARWLALAMILLAPAGVWAEGLGLKLQVGPPRPSAPVPTFIFADRIEGVPGKETTAEGNAELRKANTSIEADFMKYLDASEDVEARGNVRIERDGDVFTGPSLKYRMNDGTGVFDQPEFFLAPRAKQSSSPIAGRGRASSIEFMGEDRYKVRDVFFTTCKPDAADWYVRARELDLDYTRDVGTARGGRVVFKGLTIIPSPTFDFSLNNERKSGFLPPHLGTTGKSGAEFSLPYYFNLAPNYDMTLTPRYMAKRGLQIGSEFRYLQPKYSGDYHGDVLPNDQIRERTRSMQTWIHTYRDGALTAGLNLNKASDANYFVDLGSRINVTSQVNLLREGFVSYGGSWWGTGSYGLAGRLQSFQTLQVDPQNPVSITYTRFPQITLGASRDDIGGFDFLTSGEYVNFMHPTAVIGTRTIVYPSVTLPSVTAGSFLTPKFGVHVTHYDLARQSPTTPESISRDVPIASIDSGLIFERDARWRGQSLVQTLEPRAYYVYIPFKDQSRIPVFDTGVADLNYAQIFSENIFAGGDRINDANQVTLGLTSRMLLPSTGQEVIRGTIAHRVYFRDQQVVLDPTIDKPRTYRTSDWLVAVSGRVAANWTLEAANQYNPRESRNERLTVAARYQPGSLQTLNLSYRYLRDQIAQVDVSSQWPLGGGWYGVGRYNYSTRDKRSVETLGGIEYNANCWIARVVGQRFVLPVGGTTNTLFLQLELNGFSRIGSNPLEALKRNVPGYQRLDPQAPDQPARPFD